MGSGIADNHCYRQSCSQRRQASARILEIGIMGLIQRPGDVPVHASAPRPSLRPPPPLHLRSSALNVPGTAMTDALDFSPKERDLIRREFLWRLSSARSIHEGILLKRWATGAR